MIDKTYPFTEKLIADALILAEQLYQELNQEADALKKLQHPDLIGSIATNKKQLVTDLEQFNIQLGKILATENLPCDQQGLENYFQRAEAANLTTAISIINWQSIQSICAKSKILNERNGASLELLARHTKRSLQILKGKPQFTSTYGPDGITKSDSYARTLVMA
jgi:flagellar biosynthesis protein FlgN